MMQDANKTKQPTTRPVALITGAAKRLGAAMALALAEAGYDLVLHYHASQKEAKALAKTLEATNATIQLRQADLTNSSTFDALWDGLPTIQLLIHNASIFKRDTLSDMTEAQLDQHMNIHVKAPLLMAQAFQKQLPADQKGHFIMLSDGSYGASLSPHFFSYAASKLALSSLTDLLASACVPQIQVNTLALGATLPNHKTNQENYDSIQQNTPLKRTSNLDDVLSALRFLLANQSITGQVLNLANGMALNSYRHWQT